MSMDGPIAENEAENEALVDVALTLNGEAVRLSAPPTERLSDALRERLGAREVKVGCNAGDCGACTVLLDGAPVCACMVAVGRLEGARIDTVKGVVAATEDTVGARLAAAMHAHGAAQCGICTPGIMVSATALLRETARPSEQQVKDALGGVLCRCTGYRKIVSAVLAAAEQPTPIAAPATPAAGAAMGAGMARVDSQPKIAGETCYGDDAAPADALTLRAIRSPHPHAMFRFGDLDAFTARHPGVELVLTAVDIPGENRFGVIGPFADQPVFADGVARFRGEAVAAVIGSRDAVRALDPEEFPVDWAPLPAVEDPEAASAMGAPQLHEERHDNRLTAGFVSRGDVEAVLASSDVVVEGAFETAFVEHAYIEPEAGFARRVDDRVEIYACTQAPVMNQEQVAAIMGLPMESVRILPAAVGGGFGSKLDLTLQPMLALAAWTLGKPVRAALTRAESMMASTKRHPAKIRARLGADSKGRLTAMRFDGVFNTGAYASWGPTVANRVPVHASGPYIVPAYRAEAVAVHTHCPPSGAFRGFGVPQSATAQESLMDELADALGRDRLEFRIENALRNGWPTVTGQVFETGVGIQQCLEALKPRWKRALSAAAAHNAGATGPIRRGVGVAGGWYGCGNTSLPNPSTIKAGVKPDGTLVLHQGAVDIGQGSDTVITQIFADALGAPVAAVTRLGADTDVTPDAGKTSASRQTFVSGNAARLTGLGLRAQILLRANASDRAEIGFEPGALVVRDGAEARRIALEGLETDADGYVLSAMESYDPPTKPLDENGQGDPYALYGYAAHLVELDVDVKLGTVRVARLTAAHDVGRAVNPMLVEGQVEGGAAQGLGMALMEAYLPGRTENLHDYLIPTVGDMPPVETLIIEELDPNGPFGAKGLGEHTLIPTAPAILNAIRHATGAKVRTLPATPDRVLAAIHEAEAAARAAANERAGNA